MAPPNRLCTWPDGCKFPRLRESRFCGKHAALVLTRLRESRDYRPDNEGEGWPRLRRLKDHA